MTYEIGKTYRTVGGDRVVIDENDNDGRYPLRGRVLTGESAGDVGKWAGDGRLWADRKSNWDLLPGALPDPVAAPAPTPAPAPAPADRVAELEGALRWTDRLLETLIEGDPDELAADGGITVLDVWREEAKRAREAVRKALGDQP